MVWKRESYRHGLASRGISSVQALSYKPEIPRRHTIPTLYEPLPDTKEETILYYPGQLYSNNKDKIKAIFKEYGFKWKGSKDYPKWVSEDGIIKAEFIRENDVTQEGTITIESNNPEFLEKIKALTSELGGEITETKGFTQEEKENHKIFRNKSFNQFNEIMSNILEREKKKGAPESFLNLMERDFLLQRKEVFGE